MNNQAGSEPNKCGLLKLAGAAVCVVPLCVLALVGLHTLSQSPERRLPRGYLVAVATPAAASGYNLDRFVADARTVAAAVRYLLEPEPRQAGRAIALNSVKAESLALKALWFPGPGTLMFSNDPEPVLGLTTNLPARS